MLRNDGIFLPWQLKTSKTKLLVMHVWMSAKTNKFSFSLLAIGLIYMWMISNIHKLAPYIRHWYNLICNGLLDGQVLENRQVLGLKCILKLNNNLMELHRYTVRSEIRPYNLIYGTPLRKSCIYPSSIFAS